MDSDEIPQGQGVEPIVGQPCVDARRLRCSVPLSGPVSKVLGDDNLLIEILVRHPPKPSSLPRASIVCKHWGNILYDPAFIKYYRKHHGKPPLLGFFDGYVNRFAPIMESPDRIHAACFSLPKSCTPDKYHGKYMGGRHGLSFLINEEKRETIVWDPLTGEQHSLAFPPGLDDAFKECFCTWHGAVLCADVEDGHVHGECFSSPFTLVLVCFGGYNTRAFCSVYNSASGVWGEVLSTAIGRNLFVFRPSILVGNALFWLISGGDILGFDFEIQSLDLIKKPINYLVTDMHSQLLRMEDGGLGLAVSLFLTIQLWQRKSNYDGVVEWVLLQKTIPLEGMVPRGVNYALFVGYDEETNVIVLATMIGNFTLQLDSMQIKYIVKRNFICFHTFYPYTNFYTVGNISLSKLHKQKVQLVWFTRNATDFGMWFGNTVPMGKD